MLSRKYFPTGFTHFPNLKINIISFIPSVIVFKESLSTSFRNYFLKKEGFFKTFALLVLKCGKIEKEIILSKKAPVSISPYSPALKVGEFDICVWANFP